MQIKSQKRSIIQRAQMRVVCTENRKPAYLPMAGRTKGLGSIAWNRTAHHPDHGRWRQCLLYWSKYRMTVLLPINITPLQGLRPSTTWQWLPPALNLQHGLMLSLNSMGHYWHFVSELIDSLLYQVRVSTVCSSFLRKMSFSSREEPRF